MVSKRRSRRWPSRSAVGRDGMTASPSMSNTRRRRSRR